MTPSKNYTTEDTQYVKDDSSVANPLCSNCMEYLIPYENPVSEIPYLLQEYKNHPISCCPKCKDIYLRFWHNGRVSFIAYNIEDFLELHIRELLNFDNNEAELLCDLIQCGKKQGQSFKTVDELIELCQTIISKGDYVRDYSFHKKRRKLMALLNDFEVYKKLSEQANQQLELNEGSGLNDIKTGEEFEIYCSNLLKKNGFKPVQITPGSGDHGADIITEKEDISYAIQCKFYSEPVGNAAVQEIYAGKSIYDKDIAVIMTNSTFTEQAIQAANKLHVKLWDTGKLKKMENPKGQQIDISRKIIVTNKDA